MLVEIREDVLIRVSGQLWRDWESLTWTAAINEAARGLTFEIAASDDTLKEVHRTFNGRVPIEVTSNGETVFSGKMDFKHPRITADRRSMTVSARGHGAALVDASAVHKTGGFRKKTPEEIVRELDEARCKVSTDPGIKVVLPKFQLTPGETPFRALERMLKDQRLTLRGDADGGTTITKGPTGRRHAGGLKEGEFLGEGGAKHDYSRRYGKYKVIGQASEGSGAEATEIEGESEDPGVEGPRTRIVVVDKDLSKEGAKEYARHLRDRAAGEALRAQALVAGWRDAAGKLYEPGNLYWCESQWLDLAQDMLIEKISCTQRKTAGGGGGSSTQFELVDPRSYGGRKSKGNKSGAGWNQGED
ncbi:phage baseplate assembly protein [Bosea sp. TWI1241]|uniref:phage baseplate assembly protein n=1 Tax=Bosea sp. TWI1241 TaxID=3148904 RepID=UPI00320A72DD